MAAKPASLIHVPQYYLEAPGHPAVPGLAAAVKHDWLPPIDIVDRSQQSPASEARYSAVQIGWPSFLTCTSLHRRMAANLRLNWAPCSCKSRAKRTSVRASQHAMAVHRDGLAFCAGLCQFLSSRSCQLSSTRYASLQMHAMQRLFDIPELLDDVLAYLDASDLLRVRAVCRTLEDAVTFSPRSALKLFHADQPEQAWRVSPCMQNLCSVAGISHEESTPHIAGIVQWNCVSLDTCEMIRFSTFLGRMLLGKPAPNRIRIFRLCNCTPWRCLLRSLDAWTGALLMEDLCELLIDCIPNDCQAPSDPARCSKCRGGILQVNAYRE